MIIEIKSISIQCDHCRDFSYPIPLPEQQAFKTALEKQWACFNNGNFLCDRCKPKLH